EHAYFLDYQTDKAKYIDAIISNINWDIVGKRVGYLFSKNNH
ncbi:MAG: Fe-Mn family superoxide dismutase, partial [Defluviitaleaceae bacterium]|nr:Fe-Mn family superoxide dismutase [Defluviitaleaceae bacterium]